MICCTLNSVCLHSFPTDIIAQLPVTSSENGANPTRGKKSQFEYNLDGSNLVCDGLANIIGISSVGAVIIRSKLNIESVNDVHTYKV